MSQKRKQVVSKNNVFSIFMLQNVSKHHMSQFQLPNIFLKLEVTFCNNLHSSFQKAEAEIFEQSFWG